MENMENKTQTLKEKLEELKRAQIKRPANIKREKIPAQPTIADIIDGVSFVCPNAICQAQAYKLSKYRGKRILAHDRISIKWRNRAYYLENKCRALEQLIYERYKLSEINKTKGESPNDSNTGITNATEGIDPNAIPPDDSTLFLEGEPRQGGTNYPEEDEEAQPYPSGEKESNLPSGGN